MKPATIKKVQEMLSKDIDPIYKDVAALLGPQLRNSKYLPWILARCMTIRQAKISLALPDPDWTPALGKLKVSETFAKKLGIDKGAIESDIFDLYQKAFIFPTKKGPRPATSFVQWFDPQNHTKFDKELGDEYFAAIGLMLDYEGLEEREKAIAARIAAGMPQLARVIPRWKAIKDIPGMVPGEDIRELLKARKLFAVYHCACRKRYKDRECEQPEEVCLVMDGIAQRAIDRGAGRKISYEEAFDLMTNVLGKYPVAHIGARTDDPKKFIGLICNCHADCCVVLRGPMVIGSKYPVWEHYAKSRFRAITDTAKCSGCRTCIDRCQFKAIHMRVYPEFGEERSWVNEELCMGCGCCVETCPTGARSMKIVEPPESLKPPKMPDDFYLSEEAINA